MFRWYWWRINAWSEIAAMVASAVGFAYLKLFTDVAFPYTLIYLSAWTALWTMVVTLLTPPEPMPQLLAFYRRVRPGGPGWRPVAVLAGGPSPDPLGPLAIDWVAGCVLVYGALLGMGALLFRGPVDALLYFAVAMGAALFLYRHVSHRGWGSVLDTVQELGPADRSSSKGH